MRKAILHLKRQDPALGHVIEQVGPYRIAYRQPDFDCVVRSIVYQQVSGKAAATIYGRLIEATGKRGVTPAAILRLTPERMREAGLSRYKAAYIQDLATKTRAKHLLFEALPDLTDDDVIKMLTQVKGVGVWTAQMFLIFALRRPDVLPTADLGIRAAMRKVYGLEDLPKPAQMEKLAAPWRPYCSVACWYLWRSLDGAAAL